VSIGYPSKKIPNCPVFRDLTSIRWRVLHMSTTFVAFVSTGVTLAYSCVRLSNFCPHQQVSQTVWLFKICCTVNCKSANIIYILECSVCGLQYIGESKQPFHKRLTEHRSDLTPQEWLLSIAVLGLAISARTNRFLRLFGCLKATMGGSGKTGQFGI
jgi:hypothetical protein